MRHSNLTSGLAGVVFAAVVGMTAVRSSAAVVYSSLGSTATQTISGDGTAGLGDDYDTGKSGTFVLTGMSFYGGLSDTRDQVNINFYNLSGTKVASVMPLASNLQGIGLHALLATDFQQNGVTGVTIPGKGYVIFSPVSYTTGMVPLNPNDPIIITPGDPNPTIQLAFGGSPSVGANANTLAARTDSSGVLTTGAFAPGSTSQVAAFSLSDATTPEPTTLALVAPAAALLSSRRRRRGA